MALTLALVVQLIGVGVGASLFLEVRQWASHWPWNWGWKLSSIAYRCCEMDGFLHPSTLHLENETDLLELL